MEFSKAELTAFAKQLAYAQRQYLNVMVIAEELNMTGLGKTLKNEMEEDLLLEIAKRYAAYAKDFGLVDVDNGDVQTGQNLINEVVTCCEKHNWFLDN